MTSSLPPNRRSLTLPTKLHPLLHQGLPEFLRALDRLDVEAFSQWVVVGVSLFSQEELPTLHALTTQARDVLLARAIDLFDGNITHTAQALATSRRALRHHLKRAGLYRRVRTSGTTEREDEPTTSAEIVVDEEAETLRIVLETSPPQGAITRDAIARAAELLHPDALVYMEPGQPVLVNDGLTWLLFFDDWWNGCQYSHDGEAMGLVRGHEQLELILRTAADGLAAADPSTRERAQRRKAELVELSGAAVYQRARQQAMLPADVEPSGAKSP